MAVKYEVDGASTQTIRIRRVDNSLEGMRAEYAYLARNFGTQGRDWEMECHTLAESNGRQYDQMVIKLADGRKKEVVFDITEFFNE